MPSVIEGTDLFDWNFFISIEKDLIRTFDYVEPDPRNYQLVSFQYLKIILTAGSALENSARRQSGTEATRGRDWNLWTWLVGKYLSIRQVNFYNRVFSREHFPFNTLSKDAEGSKLVECIQWAKTPR